MNPYEGNCKPVSAHMRKGHGAKSWIHESGVGEIYSSDKKLVALLPCGVACVHTGKDKSSRG